MNWIVDDGDTLLEPGELAVVVIDVTDITGLTLDFEPNTRWTIEVQTPVGAVLDITRSMPAQLDTVMQLH